MSNGGSCVSGTSGGAAAVCSNVRAAIQSSDNCAASAAGNICAGLTSCSSCVSFAGSSGTNAYPCYWVSPASGAAAFCDAGFNGAPYTTYPSSWSIQKIGSNTCYTSAQVVALQSLATGIIM